MEQKFKEVAARIREAREVAGFTVEEMALKTDQTVEDYVTFESGEKDFTFTFI